MPESAWRDSSNRRERREVDSCSLRNGRERRRAAFPVRLAREVDGEPALSVPPRYRLELRNAVAVASFEGLVVAQDPDPVLGRQIIAPGKFYLAFKMPQQLIRGRQAQVSPMSRPCAV
jgi:hypothetical protein